MKFINALVVKLADTKDLKAEGSGSNKSFGIVFFIVFLLIALYPLIRNDPIRLWAILVSIVFLILGLLNSKILSPLNFLWFKFGVLLGKFVSPLIMVIIFFLVVTPIGILMRLLKKDLLNLKFNNKKTYWIKNNSVSTTMKDQF